MNKRNYVTPRTTSVSVVGESFILADSTTGKEKYTSNVGIHGQAIGGDAADALSKGSFWDF